MSRLKNRMGYLPYNDKEQILDIYRTVGGKPFIHADVVEATGINKRKLRAFHDLGIVKDLGFESPSTTHKVWQLKYDVVREIQIKGLA